MGLEPAFGYGPGSPPPGNAMPPEDDQRRLPSVEEINAYLEQSAARTKKRLPLALGSAGAPKAPARERKLRVAAKPISAAVPELPSDPAADSAASAGEPPSKPSGS